MAMKGAGKAPSQSQQGTKVKPAYQALNQYKGVKKSQSGSVSGNPGKKGY